MRYFSSPGSLRRPMYSGGDDPKGPGFPIRISADQSLFAAPHGFSQRTTSFIASRCQGIHQTPLRRLINPASNGQHPDATPRSVSTTPHNTRTQTPDPGPRQHCITQSARPDDPLGPDPQHPHREYQVLTRDPPVYALHHVQQPTGPPSHGRPAHTHPGITPAGRTLFPRSNRRSNGTPGTGMVGQGRLELPTSRLSSARSNQLSYWPRFREGSPRVRLSPAPRSPARVWWRRTGSNRRPAACKAAALPAELRPHAPTRHPYRTRSPAPGGEPGARSGRDAPAAVLKPRLREQPGRPVQPDP